MDKHKKIPLIDRRSAMLILGIIFGLVIVNLLGAKMPHISSAWLGFCVGGTLVIYLRTRRALDQLQEQKRAIEEEAAGKFTKPEYLAETLNQNMKRQFDSLRSENGLSADDHAILEKVERATRENKIDLYLQPIVSLEDRSVKFYEAFSRLRDESGFLLLPADYLDTVERANRIGFIDNMILLRSVQALRALNERADAISVFCNVSPATLYDQNFFALFIQYLDANADLAKNLVFEFTYPAITLVDPTIGKSLEAISERGFAFSVDHVHRFELNQSSFKRLNVKYVKAPSSLLVAASQGGEATETFKRFQEQMKAAGVCLIGEKIEGDIDCQTIKSMGISMGQGNYFGSPRPVDFYLRNAALKKAS